MKNYFLSSRLSPKVGLKKANTFSGALSGALLGAVLAAGSSLLLMPTHALAQAEPTTNSGRTLGDLQGGANRNSERTLQDLQTGASTLEVERNSRDRNATGNTADSPTINNSATGGNDNVVAQVSPETGKVTIVLTNNTGAEVTYEVIGQTAPRTLADAASDRLDALAIPTTLTAQRQNFGLVDMSVSVNEDGILEVSLERSEFDAVQGALRVREDGYVFVN